MADELLTFTMEDFERYEHDLHKRQVADPSFQAITPPSMAGRAPSNLMQDFDKGVIEFPYDEEHRAMGQLAMCIHGDRRGTRGEQCPRPSVHPCDDG